MAGFDPYDILGVQKNATASQIKSAWRRRAMETHPDQNGGQPSADFQQVQKAWELLSDPARKARFDLDGSWEEPEPDNAIAEAHQLITMTLREVISNAADDDGRDGFAFGRPKIEGAFITDQMMATLKANIETGRGAIATCEKAIEICDDYSFDAAKPETARRSSLPGPMMPTTFDWNPKR